MSAGPGILHTSRKQDPAGPPFVAASAENGLSVDPVTGAIVLGQVPGQVGNPGRLLSARAVPLNGQTLTFTGAGFHVLIDDLSNNFEAGDGTLPFLTANLTADEYGIGDLFGSIGGLASIVRGSGGSAVYTVEDFNFGPTPYIQVDQLNDFVMIENLNTQRMEIDAATLQIRFIQTGGVNVTLNDPTGEVQISNPINTASVNINGVAGFSGTVTPVTSITVDGGIVTAVS